MKKIAAVALSLILAQSVLMTGFADVSKPYSNDNGKGYKTLNVETGADLSYTPNSYGGYIEGKVIYEVVKEGLKKVDLVTKKETLLYKVTELNSIVKDGKLFFLSTEKGVVRFNPATKIATPLTTVKSRFTVLSDVLYYSDTDAAGITTLFKISPAGTKAEVVYKGKDFSYRVADGAYVLQIDGVWNRLVGGKLNPVPQLKDAWDFAFNKTTIAWISVDDKNNRSLNLLTGTKLKNVPLKATSAASMNVAIKNGKVYFVEADHLYSMNLNGTGKKEMNKNKVMALRQYYSQIAVDLLTK